MVDPSNEIAKEVAKMWTQELGGVLKVRLIDELYGSKQALHEEPYLFEASKQKFLVAGKTELEHRVWRQREVKLLRLVLLEQLIREVNNSTCNQGWGIDPEDAQAAVQGATHFKEPQITLVELDAEVTEWYLHNGRETSFKVPGEVQSSNPLNEPASVSYMKWIYCRLNASEDAALAAQNKTANAIQDTHKDEWRFLHFDDLEGDVMNDEEVSMKVHEWLLEAGAGMTKHTPESIKKTVKSAQSEASEASKNNGNRLPVRLRKDSDYYLDRFAMTEIAPVGRPKKGESSSKYRLVKASMWGNDGTIEHPHQASDEPQQE